MPCFWLHIHEDDDTIKYGDGSQVGGTSRKCLLSAFSRINPQNGKYNEYVGDEDDKKREKGIETSKCEQYQFFDIFIMGFMAGQTNQGNIITEVIYYTER